MAQNLATRTIFASATRTASPASSVFINKQNTGIQIIVDVTAAVDTPSVVFRVQGKDSLSDDWYTLLTTSAVESVGIAVFRVEPGATADPGATATAGLPRIYRVTATHADSDSITYSVGANLVI